MQHSRGPAGQALQALGLVQVAFNGRDALGSEQWGFFRGRCQGQHPHTASQLARCALAHIAAADDQYALTPKSSRQSAKWGLV